MEAITLYHRGAPVTRHPISKSVVAVGSHPASDLVLAGRGVAECQLVLERGADGCWQTRGRDERARRIEPGSRVALGEYALELERLDPTTPAPAAGRKIARAGGKSVEDDLGLVGVSTALRRLRVEIRRYGRLSSPVLVQGETGTGKELAARALHDCSPRAGGPFVPVNCGALSDGLLEDVFFGHERGAFTGAGRSHRGVFERAHGGTLFLDEIGELPPGQQAALLRVLDDGRVRRIGSEDEEAVDVRLVAATNRNLAACVNVGRFRADLFHRLSALEIETPPLRDRPADVAPLAEHFLCGFERELGPRRLDREARDRLARHPWPGNARELRNVLLRAAARTLGEWIGLADLCFESDEASEPRAVPLEELDRDALRQLVARHRGNLAAAARAIRAPRTSLRDRVHRDGLRDEFPAMK